MKITKHKEGDFRVVDGKEVIYKDGFLSLNGRFSLAFLKRIIKVASENKVKDESFSIGEVKK